LIHIHYCISSDNETDENTDDHPETSGSLSRQFQDIVERIQARTIAASAANVRVQSRQQQQQEAEEQHIANLMCRKVKLITVQPLLFSVPYGYGIEIDRCFVYLGRDTMTLRCECSDPYSASMLCNTFDFIQMTTLFQSIALM
jgi:hypothetical protein